MSDFKVYHAADVVRWLDYPGCIEVVQRAMAALSADDRPQPLRSIFEIEPGRLFGLMPGRAAGAPAFGVKLISVFHDPERGGRSLHQGVVALFESQTGSLLCVADAHELTKIRTACASAVATRALARADAKTLAIFGCGTQAESHLEALLLVWPFERILVWGRTPEKTREFAAAMTGRFQRDIEVATDPRATALAADVICTVTAAAEPVLWRDAVRPGTHINAVGSSHAGPVEIDPELVAASRYYADYRPSALAAAAEFLRARELGLVGDDHIRGEIGAVLNGTVAGRGDGEQITLYKSLGHIVQDLAAALYIHQQAGRARA
jgi:ornithine cyclodeaminase